MNEKQYWMIQVLDPVMHPEAEGYLGYRVGARCKWASGAPIAVVVFTDPERAEQYAAQAVRDPKNNNSVRETKPRLMGTREELEDVLGRVLLAYKRVAFNPEFGNEDASVHHLVSRTRYALPPACV